MNTTFYQLRKVIPVVNPPESERESLVLQQLLILVSTKLEIWNHKFADQEPLHPPFPNILLKLFSW
jgi:hypothetical protein